MKARESDFITQSKPLLKKLLERLLEKYPYASILAADQKSKTYHVSRMSTSVQEDSLLSGRGFVVKISDGMHNTEYSFNRISENALDEICESIDRAVAASAALLPEGITESSYPVPQEEAASFSGSTEYEIDPEELGDGEIIRQLTGIRDKGLACGDVLLDCAAGCNWQKLSRLFLSREKEMEQNLLWMCGSIVAFAARGEEIKNYYRPFSNCGGAELLREMSGGAEECAAIALELLGSSPITPGEYECICAPDVTGMIAHEAFGHGVEMDMFVKKRALAEQYVGKCVASPLVTMHDGAATLPEVATYFFDDEGTLARDTVIIDRGILKRGICDYQSAVVLGTEPTGNGRRESYKRKAYTRMTNTYFDGGDSTKEEMIASVQYGFLLENAASGMEDPKNWGIQCMVNIAREIKDGKLTGKLFSPIVLTGYVPDLLKSITMLSGEVELCGSGFCGKGYKEWVKVSTGGPYIKARIRLG